MEIENRGMAQGLAPRSLYGFTRLYQRHVWRCGSSNRYFCGRIYMGALIATRGTRRLIGHYNHIFNSANIGDTRNAIIADGTLYAMFTTANTALSISQITQRNTTLFLPKGTGHPNLLKRWAFYLQHEFTQANHELLRSYIATALDLANNVKNGANGKNGDGVAYTAIKFDCIEATPPQTQTVLQSDEYRLANNDTDDSKLDKTTAYSKIVLVTGAISAAAPAPLDPQF
jgi:hypothetical protein